MNRHYLILSALMLFLLLTLPSSAQFLGIGTDNPTATLDVVSSTPITTARVSRSLTPDDAPEAAVEINDNSDWGALDIYYTSSDVNSVAASYIQNWSPGHSFYIDNINLSSYAPAARIMQFGVGDALFLSLWGSQGNGVNVWTYDDLNRAFYADHSGYNSSGLFNDSLQDGVGVYNLHTTAGGIGVLNKHLAGNVFASFESDISFLNGLNVAFESYAWGAESSIGLLHDNTNSGMYGGDGWAVRGKVSTVTQTSSGFVYGGVISGDQYGLGAGININHHGLEGRAAEFNIKNNANTDAAISAVNSGNGSALIARNQCSNPSGTINIVDAAYSGPDAANHIGVFGVVKPAPGYGYGVVGTGNWYGVYANGDLGASGMKTFNIDHPLDPKHKILRHFSMESNEVLNVYQGTTVISRRGKARVELPDYFDAINVNFSYQLTAIGTPEQPYISKEIEGNLFVISGQPGSKVSWMVIANRNDAYVRAHPHNTKDELRKKQEEIGKYYDPYSHGKPETLSVFYRDREAHQPYETYPLVNSGDMDGKIASVSSKKQAIRNNSGRQTYPAKQRTVVPIKQKPERDGLRYEKMEIRQEIKTWDEIH